MEYLFNPYILAFFYHVSSIDLQLTNCQTGSIPYGEIAN